MLLTRGVIVAGILLAGIANQAVSQLASPSTGFILRFGSTEAAHEPLQRWVANSPAFVSHIAWLNANLALTETVPVEFASCGVANAFYDPNSRSIRICYELVVQRGRQVTNTSSQKPTDERLTDAVVRSTLQVIDHEVGHSLVHVLGLPVLGREEDAADGFSAFILLSRGNPQDAYSVLEGGMRHRQTSYWEDAPQSDEHSLNNQRFFNLLCWMLGNDPVRFGGYAQRGGLAQSRQVRCPSEWKQLQESWTKVLGDRLRAPARASVAAAWTPKAQSLASEQTLELPAASYWSLRFTLPDGECRVDLDILGTSGGNLDVEALVLDSYTFLNWSSASSGVTSEPVFQSARLRRVTGSVPVKGPGEYVLVVSNKFSIMTPKVARLSAGYQCS